MVSVKPKPSKHVNGNQNNDNDTDETCSSLPDYQFCESYTLGQRQRCSEQKYVSDLDVSNLPCLVNQLQKEAISVKYKSNNQTNITSFFNKPLIVCVCVCACVFKQCREIKEGGLFRLKIALKSNMWWSLSYITLQCNNIEI